LQPDKQALGEPVFTTSLENPGAQALELTSASAPTCNATAMARLDGHPVIREPEELRLHHALAEVGWIGAINELNRAALLKNQSVPEPVLITTGGTILAGFGRWRLAVSENKHVISCIEYPLSEDESLQFILAHHQTQRGWNTFVRIRLALTLEPCLQQKALENMRAGGTYKGLANLPEAHRVDVRQQIADAAGVGARNVSNVKTILQNAHTKVIESLREGALSINCAVHLCGLPKSQQSKRLADYLLERATNKVIRQAVARPMENKTCLDPIAVLQTLQMQEERQPGSVVVRAGRQPHTVILMGRDLISNPPSRE
jgi:hypothetical protein